MGMAFQTVLIKVTKRIALVHERTTASNAMTEVAFSTNLNATMKMIVMTEVMKRIVHQENRKQSKKETNIDDFLSGKKGINNNSLSKWQWTWQIIFISIFITKV